MTNKDIKKIIDWIKDYYAQLPFAKGAVVGMSGGKDSLVVAKLCLEALGKEKVYGVIMPNGKMQDKDDAEKTCKFLGIDYTTVDIKNYYDAVINNVKPAIQKKGKEINDITKINTAPRLRMTTLYAIAGSLDYLVANTSNLSEAEVGYTTKWGDNVGDFAPIANFTKNEVCEIGLLLGLPKELILKTPSDGLSGSSDEDKLGITYESLDSYIRKGAKDVHYEKILKLNKASMHKRLGVIKYENDLPNYLK